MTTTTTDDRGATAVSAVDAEGRDRSPWARALLTAVGAAAIVTLVLLAFLWPTVTSSPKNITLDVVGGNRATTLVDTAQDALEERLDARPFAPEQASSRDEAVERIRRLESYGAVVVDEKTGAVEVLTASAANPTAAQMVQQLAQVIGQGTAQQAGSTRAELAQAAARAGAEAAAKGAAAQTLAGVLEQAGGARAAADSPQVAALAEQAKEAGEAATTAAATAEEARAKLDAATAPTMTVTDIVANPADDPRGAGFALAGLPMTMGGLVGGLLMANMIRGTWRRVFGVVAYAAIAAAVMVAVLDGWFGILHGSPLMLWLAMGASLTATAAVIVGLHSLIGAPGIPIGAIITMLVGNPISGAQSPSSFLPGAWGEIGQLFVPGATSHLMRAISFFPDTDVTKPWLVLIAWAAAGLLFTAIGHHRTGGTGHRA